MSLGQTIRRITSRVAGGGAATDADLVRRFAAGRDEAAFAELVARHGPLVLGVCRRVLGHAHDAEDAAQAVFLVLARCAGRVREPAAVASWLHGVAVRVCRKAIARRATQTAPESPPPDIPAPPADAADALTWADARRSIDDALAGLPESLRVPVVLCYLEGLTRDEAAERLGWSLSTFRGRLERGRDRLRVLLVRRGFPLSAALVGVLLTESPAAATPGWVAAVTDAATGRSPVPPHVASLTHGVVPAMKNWFALSAAAVVTGMVVLFAGGQTPPDAAAVPTPAARLLKPDPKAPPLDKKFAGVWAARQDVPNGDVVRLHELRFVDGEHLVWSVLQRSAGVRSTTTNRFRVEWKGDELRLHVLERFAGEEKLPVRADDKNPRVYAFKWAKPELSPDRVGFELKAAAAAPDSPWAVTRFLRDQEALRQPDPLFPTYLTDIDRGIAKEPKYTGTPLYMLLAFGAEAKSRVWVVMDGGTLYVDRNGNGDLTDDAPSSPLPTGNPRNPAFSVGDLALGGANHTDLVVSTIRMETGSVFAKLGIRLGGKTIQHAGPTDLRLTESAKDARVLHFGSEALTAIPSHTLPSVPDANVADDFRVQVGTPGVGGGSFAAFGSEQLPKGLAPVAEFEFTPLAPDAPPKKVTVNLTERCCGDQFFAKVTVPDGVKTGLNAARVTLSFPDCPWGTVKPATHVIDVMPKRKP